MNPNAQVRKMKRLVSLLMAILLCGLTVHAQKHKSDREDAGLKSKVKSVVVEAEQLPNSTNRQYGGRRQPVYTENYDEQGNLTEQFDFDYQGNLRTKRVYFNLDGEKVSKTESIRQDYDPPPPMLPPSPAAPKTRDPRYSTKYKDTYDTNGNLIERQLLSNDGSKSTRLVYTYDKNDNKTKMEFYFNGEKLEFTTIYTYNSKGIQTGGTSTRADGSLRDKSTYEYLEFDSKGNWTKKKTSRLNDKAGQRQFEPYEITYRAITYY
jgi:hypothetical protein